MSELNQQSAAWLLGITPRALRDTDAPREPGRTYVAKHLVQWHVARNTVEEDAMLAGGDSPALEDYRRARAKLATLDLAERMHAVLPRDAAREILERWATILRRASESLRKRFGPEAYTVFEEAIGECRKLVDQEFGPNGVHKDGIPVVMKM
ncbi:MAG TPA: hypothetical protein VGN12_30330 [Pirellulales bacterium]